MKALAGTSTDTLAASNSGDDANLDSDSSISTRNLRIQYLSTLLRLPKIRDWVMLSGAPAGDDPTGRSPAVFKFLQTNHDSLVDCVLCSGKNGEDARVPAVRALLAACSKDLEKRVLAG